VTDQGSAPITCPASSDCGSDATPPVPAPGNSLIPPRPERRAGVWLFCRICGRTGRFVDPFPRIPHRRWHFP
jgi:hypothetical protein